MLTIDLLRQNTALAGLSDDQLKVIEALSKNDEAAVIGTKIGELHGKYDADVLALTGVAKNQSEKSYDYVKRAFGVVKTKADASEALNTQIESLKTEKAALEQKIADGAQDATLKQQLADATTKLEQLKTVYNADKEAYGKKEETYKKQMTDLQVGFAMDSALAGMKFKADMSDSIKQILINSAKQSILANNTPDFIDSDKGDKVLVFRDKNGQILNNPANALNPFTVQDLLSTQLKDALDMGRGAAGAGTGAGAGGAGGTGASMLSLGTCKTQVAAHDAIALHLMEQGISRGTSEFTTKFSELCTENEVSKLPIQ